MRFLMNLLLNFFLRQMILYGGPSIETQQAPAAPSSGDAVQAWIEGMPQVYETQMKYAPLEAQQQVELAQQYAEPLGAAYQKAQAAMYPETSALQEQLAERATEGMQAEKMPDWMTEQYRSDLNANMGTNVGSPIGADYMSRGMQQQAQGYRSHYENLALSAAGRQPLSQANAPQTSNYMQQYTPNAAMNYQQGIYGSQAGATQGFLKPGGVSLGPLGQWGAG